MKNKQQLRELAQQHGVKLTKRVFFTKYDDNRRQQETFMDVPRPIDEVARELKERGLV